MTEQEYLGCRDENQINAYNKELTNRFPFLYIQDSPYSWLDDMPSGWRLAFGIQMCEELKEEIEKSNLTDFSILQIKEKFGGLRFYYNGGNKAIYDIVKKYEDLSYKTCICCGQPATKVSTSWISPYCDSCTNPNEKYMEIKDGK